MNSNFEIIGENPRARAIGMGTLGVWCHDKAIGMGTLGTQGFDTPPTPPTPGKATERKYCLVNLGTLMN